MKSPRKSEVLEMKKTRQPLVYVDNFKTLGKNINTTRKNT
jgi:hypothetical protein